jgi:hypothetical protein
VINLKILKKAVKGIGIPKYCLRILQEGVFCFPLAQMVSNEKPYSFYCVGHNDPKTRKIPQDRFTVCFKNDTFDEISDYDDADLKDKVSVLTHALSVDEHMRRHQDENDIITKNPNWEVL